VGKGGEGLEVDDLWGKLRKRGKGRGRAAQEDVDGGVVGARRELAGEFEADQAGCTR
jgi:hypothetical protein